ncbi:DUF418 domain-containing protein [Bacillus anthracis]|uniref:DUF418 domain-containing protein n=1 Tax=Bacillus anthracis TaxID=1392 RepID=UPI003D1C522B
MKKLNSYIRIDTMDYLRGIALLGILFINSFQVMGNLPNYNLSNLHFEFYDMFNRKFYPILFFLFGLGTYFFMNRPKEKLINRYFLLLRRLGLLFMIGLIHTIYAPQGLSDVLTVYAIMGLLLVMFLKMSKWINLSMVILLVFLSIFTAMNQPYYGEPIQWLFLLSDICQFLSWMLLGYTMGQFKFFENIYGKLKCIVTFLIATIIIYFYVKRLNLNAIYSPTVLEKLEDYIVASMIISIVIISLQWSGAKAILTPIKFYGQMSLTNYLAQSVLLLVFSSIISFIPINSLIGCFMIHAILIIFSSLWLKYYAIGPIELLLRRFTYWSKIPNVKRGI